MINFWGATGDCLGTTPVGRARDIGGIARHRSRHKGRRCGTVIPRNRRFETVPSIGHAAGFSRITIFAPGLTQQTIFFMSASGMATQPPVYLFFPVQCRKMQLPFPGVPSAL